MGGRIRAILDAIASLLIIVVAVALLYNLRTSQPRTPAVAAGRPSARGEAPLPAEPVSLDGAWLKGNKQAKLVVIEFSDFQCPFCAKVASETLPELDQKYVLPGTILMAFRHLPLESIHPYAVTAASAAECAGRQSQFWQMHDRIFQHPQQLTSDAMRAHAVALGLDMSTFAGCLAGGPELKVRADADLAGKLGITGTPTFLIGTRESDGRFRIRRRLTGAQPIGMFQSAIDPLVKNVE